MTAVARRGAAVLGSPIAHSLSPALHRAAYEALGLDGWTYRAIACDESSLFATLSALDAEGLVGVSLTMPLKRAVVSLLQEADPIGVVNTVLFADGWRGFNTDVVGMVEVLRSADVSPDASVVVLGAGATAVSTLAALASLGITRVRVASRQRPPGSVDWMPWGDEVALDSDVVISTVPAGVTDALRPGRGLLVDVVYAPWPTALAAAWSGPVVGGLELLIAQAAEQVRMMTGSEPPVAAMRAAVAS